MTLTQFICSCSFGNGGNSKVVRPLYNEEVENFDEQESFGAIQLYQSHASVSNSYMKEPIICKWKSYETKINAANLEYELSNIVIHS